MRGYYSLIQYCPDPTKAEVANVGVVLLCPEGRFLDVKVSNGNDRVRRFFGVEGHGLDRINAMKRTIVERLANDRESLANLESFQHFIATRGNKLILTEPRNMRVENPHDDLWRLFKDLVGGRALGERIERDERGKSVSRTLRELLAKPELEHKVDRDVAVSMPNGIRFKTPYAYYNGKNSYIKPQTIHVDAEQTLKEAQLLAYRGLKLAQLGVDDREAELIVPLPEPEAKLAELTRTVYKLLKDDKVRPIYPQGLDDLVKEIEREAHPIPV